MADEQISPDPSQASTEDRQRRPWQRIHEAVSLVQPWSVLVAATALALSAVQFSIDLKERSKAREVQAWQLVATPASGNSGKTAAMEYLNRSGAPLVGIDLSRPVTKSGDACNARQPQGVFLQGVDLQDALLTGSNLTAADLAAADFRGAALNEANLSHAFLHKADFRRAHLHKANLAGANLQMAKLDDAILLEATLTGACFLNANLAGALLTKAVMSETNLSFANLSRASISVADLSGSFLLHSNLRSADLTGSDFTGAYLTGANISGADFTSAKGLTQPMLDQACGDDATSLPTGLTTPACPPERSYSPKPHDQRDSSVSSELD